VCIQPISICETNSSTPFQKSGGHKHVPEAATQAEESSSSGSRGAFSSRNQLGRLYHNHPAGNVSTQQLVQIMYLQVDWLKPRSLAQIATAVEPDYTRHHKHSLVLLIAGSKPVSCRIGVRCRNSITA
jgi:hypothetical protein